MNAPARIEIPYGQPDRHMANESTVRRKWGRPPGSKNVKPRQNKGQKSVVGEPTPNHHEDDKSEDKCKRVENENNSEEENAPDESVDNYEIFINYMSTGLQWNRKDVIVDDIFVYSLTII